jgi:putative phosphoribosyl transferase
MPFRDRHDAGRRLAERLGPARGGDFVVLGLPRGGVVVAAEVALALHAPLDVLVVRKLGHPAQPELGVGALGEGGVVVLNEDLLARTGVRLDQLEEVRRREEAEMHRRLEAYRRGGPPVTLAGRTVVIVDDGMATGSTALAAIDVVRQHGAERVILAVPVAPPATVERLRAAADEVVCLESPEHFMAIGEWYDDFRQTTDEEVISLLARSGEREVLVGPHRLPGTLSVPPGAAGIVVFAHGSGSSRLSPRNRAVAERLHDAGLGTLLFDLLDETEARDRRNVFDVELLGLRVIDAVTWLRAQPEAAGLPIGCFGASTGAAAALRAAAEPGVDLAAVVSRGGRPDLAGDHLPEVTTPTLLIVGSLDLEVLALNEAAALRLGGPHVLEVVSGASHLFEEPGTLESVVALARDWFGRHLRRVSVS